MTSEDRKKRFDALFVALPGSNVERIRWVCGVLFCRENTVRGWRLARPHRVIPEAKLQILERARRA